MISSALLDVVRCPDCAGAVSRDGPVFRCVRCGRTFDGADGYLDLRPKTAFAEQTKYLDDALHADARHESVSPPLLGSKIRNDMLRTFLALGPADQAVDLGCGSGRALVWNSGTRATTIGIDISPFFAREALDQCALLLGDLRRLPLRDGAFTKAWSLDVLEHLSARAFREVLTEANRVLTDGGALFVYTHVRKNGWIAGAVRLINRVAGLCERIGLLDLTQERLRKSDHVNPIADHDELARVVTECGFHLERVTYYTPVVGAFVENVLVRIAERVLVRRMARPGRADAQSRVAAAREARAAAKARLRRGGLVYGVLALLSEAMKLDVLLFGRIKSGPFFALLRKTGPGRPQG
jgi:SAM-dependent methyltransferase